MHLLPLLCHTSPLRLVQGKSDIFRTWFLSVIYVQITLAHRIKLFFFNASCQTEAYLICILGSRESGIWSINIIACLKSKMQGKLGIYIGALPHKVIFSLKLGLGVSESNKTCQHLPHGYSRELAGRRRKEMSKETSPILTLRSSYLVFRWVFPTLLLASGLIMLLISWLFTIYKTLSPSSFSLVSQESQDSGGQPSLYPFFRGWSGFCGVPERPSWLAFCSPMQQAQRSHRRCWHLGPAAF